MTSDWPVRNCVEINQCSCIPECFGKKKSHFFCVRESIHGFGNMAGKPENWHSSNWKIQVKPLSGHLLKTPLLKILNYCEFISGWYQCIEVVSIYRCSVFVGQAFRRPCPHLVCQCSREQCVVFMEAFTTTYNTEVEPGLDMLWMCKRTLVVLVWRWPKNHWHCW